MQKRFPYCQKKYSLLTCVRTANIGAETFKKKNLQERGNNFVVVVCLFTVYNSPQRSKHLFCNIQNKYETFAIVQKNIAF